jgi:hypothetical protein
MTMNTRKTTVLAALAMVLVLAGVALAAGTEIDMTIADNSVAYNDAIFIQGPIDVNSAGTGVIDPFLSIGGGGNQAVTKGYNTVDASAEFDTITGGDRTRPLLLSGVPEVEIGGEFYREFKLDINKARGGNPYLALNELKLFLTSDPGISGYDTVTGSFPGTDAVLVWDLGDAVVLMDYSLESGSGQSDVSFFVKSSLFNTSEDCSFGSPDCDTYLVMWNEYGNYADSAMYPDHTWENNDGFEEWGIVLRPVVDAEKTATGTYDRTITWDLTKSVSPDMHSGFIGDSFDSTWVVEATKNVSEGNYAASGTITIYNPTGCRDETCPVPEDVPAEILSVDDVIDQAGLTTNATVGCGVTFPYTLGGGETLVCSYTASTPNANVGLNTAAITVEVPEQIGGGTDTYEATADLAFTVNVTGDESVTVDDDRNPSDFPASISDSTTFTYDETFSCSTNPDDYTDGVDSDNYPNTATATGDTTNLSDSADVDVTCYIWDVSKTAEGSYQDRYGWDITKTVDPESQSGFAGDTLSWEWSITWNSIFVEEINHAVSGVITVDNPADQELTVDVTDYLTGGFAATVTCNDADGGADLTIAANSSGTCDYSAAPDSQLAQNTATATRNGVSVSDTVDVNWVKGEDVGLDATISDSNHADIPADSAQPYEYSDSHVCSTDAGAYGEDGTYSGDPSNTATITWTGGSDSAIANTSYHCYLWDVSKTAEGSYQDRYGWDITKTVDPESQSGFAGDTLSWEWSITWESFFVGEINHAVSGVITVDNPADQELTVDVTDYLTGGFAATVTCNDADGGTSLTIAANSSGTCDYSAAPGSQLAQNTATATRNGVSVSDTVDVNWVKGEDVGLDATISDSNHADIPVDSAQPYEYSDSYVCSTDAGAYGEDGTYSGDASNTATITWTGGSDSATANTSYHCYAPVVSKDADTSFTRTWEWTIDKSADQTDLVLSDGQLFGVNYEVTVTATSSDGDYSVNGDINVSNPAGSPGDMTVDLVDALNDGTVATVDCDGGATSVTVAPGATETCSYSANPADVSATLNTATATFNSIDFTATANVAFSDTPKDELDECIDVSDTNDGVLGTVCAGDAPQTFTYSLQFGKHPEADVQLECGDNTHTNTASFETNDSGDTGSDSWTVNANVACAQGCTLTPGYWKTHSEYGPAPYDDTWAQLPNGADTPFFLSGQSYYEVLWTPPKGGNAYYILANAYIAAELNGLNGASSTPEVDAALTWAETFFITYEPDDKLDKTERQDAISNARILDMYNNGLIGPGHCSE